MSNYREKIVTPEQAAQAVQTGDWVDYGYGAGFPELMDRALAARKGEVKGRPGHPSPHRGGGAGSGAGVLLLLQLAAGGL